MKYSEFHRMLRRSKSGWVYVGAEGSHYIYEKDGRRYPVPYHGSKEIGEGATKKNHEGHGALVLTKKNEKT